MGGCAVEGWWPVAFGSGAEATCGPLGGSGAPWKGRADEGVKRVDETAGDRLLCLAPRAGMTPLEREMAVLRRAEMAAHKFGTAFYPYTEALAVERAARPSVNGFSWSAGWLRPPPAECGASTLLSVEGLDPEAGEEHARQGKDAGARTPPAVPDTIAAVVKRQHSPNATRSGSIPRKPPPITTARRDGTRGSAEEGVPRGEDVSRGEVAETPDGIKEGIPPERVLRVAASVAVAAAAAAS